MKKKITLGVLIGLLVITGCSKQPSLKDAKEVQTTSSQFVGNENSRTNESGNGVILDEGGIVSTENANVEEETISSTVVSTTSNNQEFAKKLSSIIVYFDFDKYNIRADQWPKVEQLAELIKSNPSNYTVRIEGNCDEWGTEEYNYALGLKRANSVKNALI
ncbi:MAG TPA: flagellar motor protein MotB, partial [Nautiliaceae bacterium]|nr:flagellar motor protein MotB [Nautiliaceae bacterium]